MTKGNRPTGYSPDTPRAARFCEEYLVDLCAAKAAERAGYAKRSAKQARCLVPPHWLHSPAS